MSWQPYLYLKGLPSQNKAMAYILISIFFFSFMGIFIRKSSENIHIFEVIFFRNLLACIILVPLMYSSGLASFKMHRPGLLVWRAIFVSIGIFQYSQIKQIILLLKIQIVCLRPMRLRTMIIYSRNFKMSIT